MVIEEEEGRKEGSLLLCFWAKRAQKRMFDRRVDVSEVLSKFVSEFFWPVLWFEPTTSSSLQREVAIR